jgi:hypothetical protein
LEIVPPGHGVHSDEPALENVPAGQSEQPPDPAGALVPAEHCVQDTAPVPENVPAEQAIGPGEPAGQ